MITMSDDEVYIDHEATDEVTCPWCGYEWSDSWESDLDESASVEDLEYCDECDKGFYPSRQVYVSYSTEKAKYGDCVRCGDKDVVIAHRFYGDIESHCASKCYLIATRERMERKYQELAEGRSSKR